MQAFCTDPDLTYVCTDLSCMKDLYELSVNVKWLCVSTAARMSEHRCDLHDR